MGCSVRGLDSGLVQRKGTSRARRKPGGEGGARNDGGQPVDAEDSRSPRSAQRVSRGATDGVRDPPQRQGALALGAVRGRSKVSLNCFTLFNPNSEAF